MSLAPESRQVVASQLRREATRAYITQRAKSRRRTARRSMCRGDRAGRDEHRGLSTVELKTYDWRMARTANPSTAGRTSRSSRSTSIRFAICSRTWAAGRGRESCTPRSSITCSAASRRQIVYDVNFAERGYEYVSDRRGDDGRGRTRTRRSPTAIRKAGNVILLAEATFEGDDDP